MLGTDGSEEAPPFVRTKNLLTPARPTWFSGWGVPTRWLPTARS